MRGPYDARTGIARGTHGVLRIIQPNHNYTAVSSRTEPVAWCDHENSTDVKFLRPLHSALRARNRTGDKNRTRSVVGCDWGITETLIQGQIKENIKAPRHWPLCGEFTSDQWIPRTNGQ